MTRRATEPEFAVRRTALTGLALVQAHLMDALTAVQAEADRLEPDPPAFVPEPTAEPRVITWDKLEALDQRDWTRTPEDIADALAHAGVPPVWPADLRDEVSAAFTQVDKEFAGNDVPYHHDCMSVAVRVLAAHGVSVSGAPEWVTA